MRMEVAQATPTVTHVRLIGRLDIAGAQAIDLHFNVLVGSSASLIVDLSEVDFIASMGMRTLMLGARAMASKRRRMVLCGAGPQVSEVLVVSGIGQIVAMVEHLDAALQIVSA